MRFLLAIALLLACGQALAQAPPPPPVLDQDGQSAPQEIPQPGQPAAQPHEISAPISTPAPPPQPVFQQNLAVAQSLLKHHRHEAAYDHLSELYKQSQTPELRMLLAGAAQQTGRLDEAGKLLQLQADKEFGQKQIELTRWINALAAIEVALSSLIDGKYALVLKRLTPNIDEFESFKNTFANAGIPDAVFLALTWCIRLTTPKLPGAALFQTGTRSYYLATLGYEGGRETAMPLYPGTAMPLIERRLGDAADEGAVDMLANKGGFLTLMTSQNLGNPLIRTRLQQVDATGRTEWMLQFGGGQKPLSMALVPNGDIVVAGTYPAPRTEIWLTRISAAHKIMFDLAVPSPARLERIELAVRSDGSLLVGGPSAAGTALAFQVDATGKLSWARESAAAGAGPVQALLVTVKGMLVASIAKQAPSRVRLTEIDDRGTIWNAELAGVSDPTSVSGIFAIKGGYTLIGNGKHETSMWFANVSGKGKIGKSGYLPVNGHAHDVAPCGNNIFCVIAQNAAVDELPTQQLLKINVSNGKITPLLNWPVAMQQMKSIVALKNNQLALFGDSMAPGQQARDGIFWRGVIGR